MKFDFLFLGIEVIVRRFGFLRFVGNILYIVIVNFRFILFGTFSFVFGLIGVKVFLLNGND